MNRREYLDWFNEYRRRKRSDKRQGTSKTCPVCSRAFTPLKTTSQKFCGLCSKKLRPKTERSLLSLEVKRQRRNARLRRISDNKRLKIDRNCAVCGAAFNSKISRARFCSDGCEQERLNIAERERAEKLLEAKVRLENTKSEIDRRRLRALRENGKPCKQCSSVFRPPNDRFDYCSPECKKIGQRGRDNQRNKTDQAKSKRNAFLRKKIATNPEFKLRGLISKQVWRALKITRSVKSDSTLAFLPYSIPQLKAHLESFFSNKNGFTWENHGKVWQIDHIIPQSMFPFTSLDSKEFRDCWALSNLMPANKHFNHRKGNRFIGTEDSSGQLVFSAASVNL